MPSIGDPGRSGASPVVTPIPMRTRVAALAVHGVNVLSRVSGRGSGTVAGGRVGLALDPAIIRNLTAGKTVALVSGTNGKTTTSRLLVAALGGGHDHSVAWNDTGANMPAGHVAALVHRPRARIAVLEVDESYLDHLLEVTRPEVVILLNLSRDQLDRVAEVRLLAERWRKAFEGQDGDGPVVVANADDPMVVWAAGPARRIWWVGAGQVWREDAVGCPACGGRIAFSADGWACDHCPFARPVCHGEVLDRELVLSDGSRHALTLGLPGAFNRSNAALVAVATEALYPGRSFDDALSAMAAVTNVAGRFAVVVRHGHPVRKLLAKNPAGWTAIFDLLDEVGQPDEPVVLSINARAADGTDPSWLWDVPFERLQGRSVVAAGDRCLDLAVRLRYAEVDHQVARDPLEALDLAMATAPPGGALTFLGNYTAFSDLGSRL